MRHGLARLLYDFEPEGGEGDGGGEGEGGVGEGGGEKMVPQSQVDRIIQDRLARDRKGRPSDEEIASLREKATKFDEVDAAGKTELQRATEAREAAERKAAEASERAQRKITEASILAEAAGKFADPTDAVSLIDRNAVEYDADGSPTNVADLVSSLLTTKPHLAAQRSSGNADLGAREGNGVGQLTLEQLRSMSPADVVKADAEGRFEALKRGGK